MADNRTFTVKSNAKRGAERHLATGGAPATAYTIRTRDDGLFEIVWLTATPGLAMAGWPAPTAAELEAAGIEGAALAVAIETEAEAEAERSAVALAIEAEGKAAEAASKRRAALAAVEAICGPDGAALAVAIETEVKAANQRVAKSGASRRLPPSDPSGTSRRRATRAPEELPPGTMPTKPTVPDTFASYRKRLDRLEAMALAGDWAGVAAYEVKGANTYSKIVRRYRDRLCAAHTAQIAGVDQ